MIGAGRMRRSWAAFSVVLAASCFSTRAHEADGSAATLTRIPVTVEAESGSIVFQAELADSDETRMRGLMFRKSMGDREGMIFLFPHEQQLSFWMRNTLIPLDMVFIKADHTILGVVENATPKTDTPRMVPGQSQFVLEINGGVAKKEGIKAGQKVAFYAPIPVR